MSNEVEKRFLAMTPQAMRKMLVEFVEVVLNYPRGRVVVETKTDRRPADGPAYASLWFKEVETLVQNHGEFIVDDEGDMSQILDNESHVTVRISLWGDEAYDETLKCSHALHSNQRVFDLWRVFGYSNAGTVVDVSSFYGGKIQQRAYFEFSFYVCFGTQYPADWFEVSQWGIHLPSKPYSEEFVIPKEE